MILLISGSAGAQVTAAFTTDTTAGCLPLVVHFRDQSAGNPTQWVWNLGNGTISHQQNPTGTYFQPGTYNIKLVIKNAAGSDSVIKNQFITVYANPLISFNLSDSSGCFPKTVQFTDNTLPGSGNITQWSWDFGDGNISAVQHPLHTYTQPGTYSPTLKVVNSFSCQSTFTRSNVITLGSVTAAFDLVNNSGCLLPAGVTFINRSSNAATYSWDFGDGSRSAAANPAHNYTAAGTYNVRLVATSSSGCTDTITKTVLIGKAAADFVVPSPACVGAALNFQNTSSSVPAATAWSFGDGTVSTQVSPSKAYTIAGTYQVKLIADFGTCADTITKNIVVHPRPVAAFTATGDLLKCGPDAVVRYSGNSTGAASYLWSFGDGNTSTAPNAVHTYTANGIFNVSLTVVNNFGCSDMVTKPGFVKVTPPHITGISGAGFRGCGPYTAHLAATIDSPDPVTGWQWDFGDGGGSTVVSPTHVYTAPGIYTIRLVIRTAGGCTDTYVYTAAVQIGTKPVANFTATPLSVCAAAQVQFTNLSTGADEWYWTFGDGGFITMRDPAHQFGDTGLFTIRLIASNLGCADTLTRYDYVRNDPPIGRHNIITNCNKPYEIQFRDSSIGGQTYKWQFGDGDSSTLRHPVHTYNTPGTYKFYFTVYHGSCFYRDSGFVNIVDERPTLSLKDTALCKYTSAAFAVANSNASNISSYYWDFDDGNSVTNNSAAMDHNYTIAGTYHPRLIVTDVLGCTDTLKTVVQAKKYGPVAGFSNIEGTCVDRGIIFREASAGDGVHPVTERQWTFGDGTSPVIAAGDQQHIYHTKGSYTVSLRVKDSYGCYDSITKTAAVIITDPSASFIMADSVKCSGNSVQFNNNSDGLELSYGWDFGDGTSSPAIHPLHSYQASGTFDVRMIATDKFGCRDTVSKRQVISDPSAAFIASDTFSTCPPLLVNLSNRSANFTGVTWSFGDGSASSNSDPSHYYTAPGTYRLKLYVNGYGNCRDSVSKTVIVKGPSGTFRFTPNTICANGSVGFTAHATNNTGFIWDFSDGITNPTADSMVVHKYEVPGLYQPKLILIDTAGCQVPVTTPDTLTVTGVQAKIGSANNFFCDSVTMQLKDSSILFNDVPLTYNWSFGDGGSSALANPFHRFNHPGSYDVGLVITTRGGCTDSVTVPAFVTVALSPHIAISGRADLCITDTLQLRGRTPDADSSTIKWAWDLGNGNFSSGQNASASYSSAGNRQVTLVAFNNSGCSDTAVSMILVHPLPNVKAGTDTMICRGQSYTLQSAGAATYEWRSDPSLNCINCPDPVIKPLSNTTYYVKGTSLFGCVANDSVSIDVIQPFTIRVNSNDTLCAGDKIQLVANGAVKYSWFPAVGLSSTTIANPVASPGATTVYTVVGNDAKNCFTDTGYVKLSVFPVPQFNIIDNVLTMAAGNTAVINTTGSADITHWKWYPSKDLSCADCPQPVVTAKDNITYRAEVWNDGGCASADKISISVICNDGNVFIPNTFSPNKDGMNDVFYVRGKGINSVKSMKIFNRWGQLVFERNESNANDVNAGWNGTYQNIQLTPDVYVYIVDVVCSNNTVFTLKGNVTLIR